MSPLSFPAPPLLTREEAAAYLGVATQTLSNWATTGKVALPFIRLSPRAVRYRQADLDNFLAERTVTHTGE